MQDSSFAGAPLALGLCPSLDVLESMLTMESPFETACVRVHRTKSINLFEAQRNAWLFARPSFVRGVRAFLVFGQNCKCLKSLWFYLL